MFNVIFKNVIKNLLKEKYRESSKFYEYLKVTPKKKGQRLENMKMKK